MRWWSCLESVKHKHPGNYNSYEFITKQGCLKSILYFPLKIPFGQPWIENAKNDESPFV
jgi:hypothetical protein